MADPSAKTIDPLKARLGANLKRARRAAGISQEELAFRAGLHRTAIGLLERGLRSPELGTIVKLADCLEVDLQTLSEGVTWCPPAAGTPGHFEITPAEE